MFPKSEELFERSLKVAPGGVHSPVRSFRGLDRAPVFFQSAAGAYLTSVEGRRYVDFCQSFGPLVLGHRDPDVQEGVLEMISTAWTFGACEPYSLELAEWVQARLPWMERMRFVSSGTEAVMSALRVARAATGRAKILKFEGCYHGHADALLVKAGSGLAGATAASSAGVTAAAAGDTLAIPLDDELALEAVFAEHGAELAALILEPLPANYGLLPQREEFLRKAFALARAHGALVIFDEVISGFRIGLGGMAARLGFRPDLATYGKVLGGGFPVGAYGGRAELMDLVAPAGPVYQAGTLSANPVGMRAGLLTLQKMERVNGWEALERKGAFFAGLLAPALAEANLNLVRAGSLFWIHERTPEPVRAVARIPANLAARFRQLFNAALADGVYLAPNAYEVGFISLAHTEDDLRQVAAALARACRE
jgi:glutamate-1-semialdehyde 2,1-aminomutase